MSESSSADAARASLSGPHPGRLAQRLAEWLAERVGAPRVELRGFAPPGTGMSSETRLFEARWSEAGGSRRLEGVLRAAPSGEGPFPDYDMALQFHVMERLRRHTQVPVPEVLWLEENDSVLGVPFLIMRRVRGEAPLDFRPSYHAAGFYRDATPAGRRTIWQGVIDALAALHRADLGVLAIPGLPGEPLDYWRRYYVDWLKDTPDEPIAVFDEALAYLEAHDPSDARRALCWGDAKLGNVMFHPGAGARAADPAAPQRVTAVVDWEMATLGDPEMDLASLVHSDERAQIDAGCRLDGTPDAAELVAMYEAASGERVRNFHRAQVFAAFWRGAVALKVMRRLREKGTDVPDAMFDDSPAVRSLRRLLDL